MTFRQAPPRGLLEWEKKLFANMIPLPTHPPLTNSCAAIGSHAFEARYDEVSRGGNYSVPASLNAEEIRRMTLLLVYVCDVCTRCGATIARKQ